ncbi:ABA4 protein [Tothia fuscella]|uniref:ABA4 protein n=1 Tax=Tothia fuscella TaxID=1048955 RepID=A0A9P4U5I0_9PEZI|nr:ABA4 protein [Tothia fuscella]
MAAPNFNLSKKVICITGGGSGIGFALAKLLLSQGAHVSIADISSDTLESAVKTLTSENYSGQLMSAVVDVRKVSEVDGWIKETVEKFGKLDGAANLAGVIPKSINVERVEELNEEDWLFTIDVNLNGVMRCMRAELQNMNPKGSIINASSVAGVAGFPKNAAYTASKHAVIGLSRTAAKEVGDREIRINCISPGVIDTPMHRASEETRAPENTIRDMPWSIKRKGQADEVAALIAWLLCDSSSYITGTVQLIDGGWMC